MSAYLIKDYTEAGYQQIPSLRLSEDAYTNGLQCFVFACSDVVPIDRTNKTIYLARRTAKPMNGWWWIGGRMAPHETKKDAAIRNFARETHLLLSHERLHLTAIFDCRFKDRQQMPQEIGCHLLTHVFITELTKEELATVATNLDAREYESAGGLVAFNREQLIAENVFPAVIDLYDHLFPLHEEVECGTLSLVSSDLRRSIQEFEFNNSSFQNFVVHDGSKPLGQHYHEEKFEIFYFIQGGGIVRTAEVGTEKKIIGDIKTFKVEAGSVIRVPPYHTHRFDLIPGTHFVVFSAKKFDMNDMIVCPIL